MTSASTACSIIVVIVYHKDSDEELPSWLITLHIKLGFGKINKNKRSITRGDNPIRKDVEFKDEQTGVDKEHEREILRPKLSWKEAAHMLDHLFGASFNLIFFIIQVTFVSIALS